MTTKSEQIEYLDRRIVNYRKLLWDAMRKVQELQVELNEVTDERDALRGFPPDGYPRDEQAEPRVQLRARHGL